MGSPARGCTGGAFWLGVRPGSGQQAQEADAVVLAGDGQQAAVGREGHAYHTGQVGDGQRLSKQNVFTQVPEVNLLKPLFVLSSKFIFKLFKVFVLFSFPSF